MIITRAPLRVSFLGGGTDFPGHFETHGGAVLATSIDKYVYVTASPFLQAFHGSKFKLSYRQIETVKSIPEIQHAAMRACFELAYPDGPPLEVHHIADLPANTGLGSSSSFAVALLHALHASLGKLATVGTLAREAIRVEREILAEAGGWQDQICAAYGGLSLVEFGVGRTFQVTRLPLSSARAEAIENHCLLLFTGILRNSFEVLQTQVARTADGSNLEHLKHMAELARRGARVLAGDTSLETFGELLNEGWTLKRKLADVSMPAIDDAYEAALKAGATGGKLLGAGKGGFLLVWAKPERHAAILKALPKELVPLRVSIRAPGATIIHS